MSKIERKSETNANQFWVTRIFIVTINVLLTYLLLGYVEILYLTAALAVLNLTVFGYFFIKSKKKDENVDFHETKNSSLDTIWISRKYIFMNKKYNLAALLGLILAIMIISQAVLFSTSYNQDSFDEFQKSADTTALRFEIDGLMDQSQFITWKSSFEAKVPELMDDFNLDFNSSTSWLQLNLPIIAGSEKITEDAERTIPTVDALTRTISESALTFLRGFPTFDKSRSLGVTDTIVIISNEDVLSGNLTESTLSGLADAEIKTENDNSTFRSFALNASYIWSVSNLDLSYFQNSKGLFAKFDIAFESLITQTSILVPEDKEWDYFNIINSIVEGVSITQLLEGSKIMSEVEINLPNLVDVNLLRLVSNLEQLQNVAESWAYSSSGIFGFEINVESPLKDSVENYQEFIGAFNVILFFISGLLAGVALFLVYLSLTLAEQRKRKLVSVMKVRGASDRQLQLMLLVEALGIAIIAIGIGMVISIPWTKFTLNSSGPFNFASSSVNLSIPSSWYWRVPLIGLILAFDTNIYSIITITGIEITEGESTLEKKQPFWQRIYLDLVLFTSSVIFWSVLRFIPIRSEATYDFFVEGMGPTMMIILVIGAPLVFARYFGSILSKVSNVLWSIKGGLTALSMRNLWKNKFSMSRLASLLMVGIMLSVMSIVTPETIKDWGTETSAYELGADIYIQGISPSNSTSWGKLQVPGISSISEIAELTIAGGPFGSYSLLGINNSNFARSAFWDDSYDPKSLNSIIAPINSNSSIGIQQDVLQAMGLGINDKLSIPLSSGEIRKSYLLDIRVDFKYFPALVTDIPNKDQFGNIYPTDLPILADYSLLFEMNKLTENVIFGAYIKINPSHNLIQVTNSLRTAFASDPNIVIQNKDEANVDFLEVSETKILISSLSGVLIVTLIVSFLAMAFYSFITLAERKREIGLFKALGMVRRQIFFMLIMENLILVFVTLIFGSIMGVFVSYTIFLFMTLALQGGQQGDGSLGGSVPPLKITLPLPIIIIFATLLIVLSIIAAAIPAQMTARSETGNILRED